ncbi:MAG: hypothetical protein E7337_07110 [Clostridiales bacterium]|nr:hypothetical protein [Clostridiales bacterium]
MKCPYCDDEMINGVVQGARGFFFATERHGFWMRPNTKKGEVMLSSENWFVPTCTAYHCPNCKKVVFDYAQKPE